MSHRGSGLSSFLTKPLIHLKPFLEYGTPVRSQIGSRMDLEASALNQPAIVGDRAQRLNSHSFPHQLSIIGRELLIGDPICESQPAVFPKYSKRLGERLPWVRYMAKRFLADDSIHNAVSKWNAHDVSFNDLCPVLKPNPLSQFLSTCDTRWRQFNSGDIGTIFVGEIPSSATKSCAEIRYTCSACDLASTRQFIRRCQSAVVILVMRKQIFGSQMINMTATCAQLRQDDVAGNWMPIINISHLCLLVPTHTSPLYPQ